MYSFYFSSVSVSEAASSFDDFSDESNLPNNLDALFPIELRWEITLGLLLSSWVTFGGTVVLPELLSIPVSFAWSIRLFSCARARVFCALSRLMTK